MVEKAKLTSLQPTSGSNIVYLDLDFEEDSTTEESSVNSEETLTVSTESDSPNIVTVQSVEEVIENTLVQGTNNIYITEKKYILPIENLENATYNVD